ncbi:MAG TPA: carboxymuconolactone decarboxylase family protein [Thermomicrobiales bacterium]|nr:carboxymuconolactone decarboxylase family protein [Thermomicrobiales bacterium]
MSDDKTAATPQASSAGGKAEAGAKPKAARGGLPPEWAPTERISWFPIPTEEELDPRVADLARRQREVLGGPNNVVRVHAWRPEAMLRWLDFYEHISKGPSGLSRAEREMIGVVVSAENRCIF